jgi:hypothetical protein
MVEFIKKLIDAARNPTTEISKMDDVKWRSTHFEPINITYDYFTDSIKKLGKY